MELSLFTFFILTLVVSAASFFVGKLFGTVVVQDIGPEAIPALKPQASTTESIESMDTMVEFLLDKHKVHQEHVEHLLRQEMNLVLQYNTKHLIHLGCIVRTSIERFTELLDSAFKRQNFPNDRWLVSWKIEQRSPTVKLSFILENQKEKVSYHAKFEMKGHRIMTFEVVQR